MSTNPSIGYVSFQNHVAFTLNRATAAGAGDKAKFTLPADGWYQIARYGEMRKALERDDKDPVQIVQVFNRASAKRIVSHFEEEAKAENFSGLLSDFDHFSFDKTKSTIASAWIENVQDRDNGLWAQLRLTGSGETALTSGDYRGFSPVFGFPPREYAEGERVEPEVILAGALTNQPTFKGMVPLSNRQGDPLAKTKNAGVTMDYKAKLLALLKLPSTATDAEIEAATGTAGETMNKGAQYDATKNRLETLLAAQIETDLDGLGLKGDARAKAKVALTKNRDEALELFTALGGEGGYARTHNRDAARTPKEKTREEEGQASPEEEARAARVRNRADDLVRTDKIPFAIAFNRADAAEPAIAKTK